MTPYTRASRRDRVRTPALRSFLGASILATAAILATAEPALAQQRRPADRAQARPASPKQPAPKPVAVSPIVHEGGPLVAVVSIGAQRISVYNQGGLVTSSPVSTGRSGYETPQGVFSIIEKNVEHFSNLYNDAPMPYMQRITWSGVAMHAGALPGYPASHGCIRLPHAFSRQLFELTPRGTRVIVAQGSPEPRAVAHPRLFSPRPMSPERLSSLLGPAPAAQRGATVETAGIAASSGPAAAAMRLTVSASAALDAALDTAIPAPPPRTLDAARAEAQLKLEAALKAEAEAKARHAAKLKERAATLTAISDADRSRLRGEALLKSAQRARLAAKTEHAAKKAEAAEEQAAAQIKAAEELIAAADPSVQEARAEVAKTEADVQAAELSRKELATLVRDLDRKARPVSVFVSRKTQRLYVRQGNQPVFDTPVTIRDPQMPIGTHVFTAMSASQDKGTAAWSVVSAVDPLAPVPVVERSRPGRGRAAPIALPPRSQTAGAIAALERLEIPEETIQRISESIRAGASLIISDEPISSETGRGTDFVILTK